MKEGTESVVDKYKKLGIITWSIIGLVLVISVAVFLLFKIKIVLSLFLYALVIVYVLRPVVDYFEKKGISRILAIILSYLLLFLIILLASTYFIPLVIAQVKSLINNIPVYSDSIQRLFENYQGQFETLRFTPSIIDFIENLLTRITDAVVKMISHLPTYTVNVFSFVVNVIVTPLFALVISFYILKDLKQIKETFINLIPTKYRDETRLVIRKVDGILRGFLKGQFLVILVVGALSWLALLLLGVEYAFALAVIIGLLDIVPYFGPILGGAIAVIVALFKSPVTAFWVVIAMMIIQQIESLFIAPNLMSKRVNLHPLAVIFAILVGGTLFGISGIILAIPVAAVTKGIFYYYLEKREPQSTEL